MALTADALEPNTWYSTADAAELLNVQPNTVTKRFGVYANESPDDDRLAKIKSDDQRGRPSWQVQGSLLAEMAGSHSPPPSGDVAGLRRTVEALSAEVAGLREELRTVRDGELTNAMALNVELDQLKRKYRAVVQALAVDADLDV